MNTRKFSMLLIILFSQAVLLRSQDTIGMYVTPQEVVVSATKSSRLVQHIPSPVEVINQSKIQQSGLSTLDEVLAQFTTINIIEDFGRGVQLQGLDPDYTLILIDGEPMIGRNGGTLDLSRISMANVKQVEIIKGPSSSLYGSNALAGVINIVTLDPQKPKLTLGLQAGNRALPDAFIQYQWKKNNTGISIFSEYQYNQGYDWETSEFGQTVEPFQKWSLQGKWTQSLADFTKLDLNVRHHRLRQINQYLSNDVNSMVSGYGIDQESSINLNLQHFFHPGLKSSMHLYYMQYAQDLDVYVEETGELSESQHFAQKLFKPEIRTEIFMDKGILQIGTGIEYDWVNSSRYEVVRDRWHPYIYGQWEGKIPTSKLQYNLSTRYDYYPQIAQNFSPKASAKYSWNDQFHFGISLGTGFKVPDFRQLYLNFGNTITGYTVFGTEVAEPGITDLQAQGLISELLISPTELGTIKPERSYSTQIFGQWSNQTGWKIDFQFFRHHINQLIETISIARKTNGQFVYSYKNLESVYSQGTEISLHKSFLKNWKVRMGYQFTDAQDRNVRNKIKSGEVYRRDPETQRTERINLVDYGGLFNRSKHQGNISITYQVHSLWTLTGQIVLRNKFGLFDINGNSILDADVEYVKGYESLNFTLTRQFKKGVFSTGIYNLLNTNRKFQTPQVSPRRWHIGYTWNIDK